MNLRGQSTIEYLIIIGVVLTIALFAAYLLMEIINAGQGSSLSSSQSKQYWMSQSIALSNAVVNASGDAIFVLTNNTDDQLKLVGFGFEENNKTILNTQITFNPRETKAVFLQAIGACTGSQSCAYDKIFFYYLTPDNNLYNSGGYALALARNDSSTYLNLSSENDYVCVLNGELQACNSGGGTTQYVNVIYTDSNRNYGVMFCTDGNVVIGYLNGYDCVD